MAFEDSMEDLASKSVCIACIISCPPFLYYINVFSYEYSWSTVFFSFGIPGAPEPAAEGDTQNEIFLW